MEIRNNNMYSMPNTNFKAIGMRAPNKKALENAQDTFMKMLMNKPLKKQKELAGLFLREEKNNVNTYFTLEEFINNKSGDVNFFEQLSNKAKQGVNGTKKLVRKAIDRKNNADMAKFEKRMNNSSAEEKVALSDRLLDEIGYCIGKNSVVK